MNKDVVYRMYLPNKYWIFKGEHEFRINERDEELLLGKYDNYTFPIVYKESGACRYYYDINEEDKKLFRLTHFMKTDHGGRNFAVSDEVIELLLKNNITGWKTYPVEVYTQEDELIRGFNGFTITGRCGAVKPSLCEEVIIPPTYKGGPSVPGYKGDPLDLDTWDGSDIFILEHTVYKYATAKVRNVLSKLKNSNVAFEDIAERLIPQKDAIWKPPMGVVINE